MKTMIQGFILTLAMIATSAHAIPTLEFFGGDAISGGVTYTADAQNSTGTLEVDAYLIGSTDITPLPILSGSSLTFTATLDSTFTQDGYIAGLFTSTDLVINGGGTNPVQLLTGNFTLLGVAGDIGTDGGFIQGNFTATGGSLISNFGLGSLFAINLNVSRVFDLGTFNNNFTAQIDGQITGEAAVVPEPSIIALLGAGILLFGFSYRAKTSSNFDA